MGADRQDPDRPFARVVVVAFAILLLLVLGALIAVGMGWTNH